MSNLVVIALCLLIGSVLYGFKFFKRMMALIIFITIVFIIYIAIKY